MSCSSNNIFCHWPGICHHVMLKQLSEGETQKSNKPDSMVPENQAADIWLIKFYTNNLPSPHKIPIFGKYCSILQSNILWHKASCFNSTPNAKLIPGGEISHHGNVMQREQNKTTTQGCPMQQHPPLSNYLAEGRIPKILAEHMLFTHRLPICRWEIIST